MKLDEFPNIEELLDLWPFLMQRRHVVELDGKKLREYKYANPLGKPGDKEDEHEVLAYFDAETMQLDRIMYRKNDSSDASKTDSASSDQDEASPSTSTEDMFNPFTLYAP